MNAKLHCLIVSLLVSFLGFAQPGEIDNSFNSSGIGAYGGTLPPGPMQPSADAVVYTSSVYPATSPYKDKIIIGGRFTSYNGEITRKVARLNPDGTFDDTFEPNIDITTSSHYVYCSLALPDGSVIIGGSFSASKNGITYRNIIKFDANGVADPTFMANGFPTGTRGFNHLVHALALDGNKIVVGGDWSSRFTGNGAGVLNTKKVVRLLPDGSLDPTFDVNTNLGTGGGNFGGEVRALTVQHDGKILVGGFFDRYTQGGTIYYKRFVRLNADGTYDTTFDIGTGPASGADVSLAVYASAYLHNTQNPAQSKILAVGNFGTWNGASKAGIVRLNLDGSLDTSFNAGNIGVTGPNRVVFAIQMQPDGKILLGGSMRGYNNVTIPKGILRLNADGTRDTDFLTGGGFYSGTGVYGSAGTLRNIFLQSDGKIIVSGDFTEYDNNPRRMIARIKTRECFNAAVYYDETGWDGGQLPVDDTYYVVIVDGTVTVPSGMHLQACELEIKPGATLIIEENASITVKGMLMNNGTFIVNDSGALVQIDEDIINADLGNGVFNMYRNTTPVRRFDFTYWSSPTESQNLRNFSPGTLPDKFYSFNTPSNSWYTHTNPEDIMEAGKGYIIRAPQSHSTTVPSVYYGMFEGRPNNGIVETTIRTNGANHWNLIGNPYPSAIDIDAFINDPANENNVGGTIYLWTHDTDPVLNPATGIYEYTAGDYAVYNQTGMVNTSPNGTLFNGKLAAGQAFFIEGKIDNSKVRFSNTMRLTDQNTQFYRQGAPHLLRAKHRLWLNIKGSGLNFNQTLIGYVPGATAGLDRIHDGKVFSSSPLQLYSLLNAQRLSIQGRGYPFNNQDIVPLGYLAPTQGQYTIEIGNQDGIFADEQIVYLIDKSQNVIHNLTEGAYQFSTMAGTFDDRFEIRYENDYGAPVLASQRVSVLTDEAIHVNSPGAEMTSVTVYDITGKVLFQTAEPVNRNDFTAMGIAKRNQMLLVEIGLNDGSKITRKVIF